MPHFETCKSYKQDINPPSWPNQGRLEDRNLTSFIWRFYTIVRILIIWSVCIAHVFLVFSHATNHLYCFQVQITELARNSVRREQAYCPKIRHRHFSSAMCTDRVLNVGFVKQWSSWLTLILFARFRSIGREMCLRFFLRGCNFFVKDVNSLIVLFSTNCHGGDIEM